MGEEHQQQAARFVHVQRRQQPRVRRRLPKHRDNEDLRRRRTAAQLYDRGLRPQRLEQRYQGEELERGGQLHHVGRQPLPHLRRCLRGHHLRQLLHEVRCRLLPLRLLRRLPQQAGSRGLRHVVVADGRGKSPCRRELQPLLALCPGRVENQQAPAPALRHPHGSADVCERPL